MLEQYNLVDPMDYGIFFLWNKGQWIFEVELHESSLKIIWLILKVFILWFLVKTISLTMLKTTKFGKKEKEKSRNFWD